jgi:hypothetical protein
LPGEEALRSPKSGFFAFEGGIELNNHRNIKSSDWYNCYRESWGQDLVPAAYSHPAKVNRGLARKIYAHAIEEGWLSEGDVCIDPFAGIGGFALDAMFHGLRWVGVELEEKFVGLGGQNIALWNSRYNNGMLPRWGTAVILQGDSRNLVDVLDGARVKGIIGSPPYVGADLGGDNQRKLSGSYSAEQNKALHDGKGFHGTYGKHNPLNLGNMREGDHEAAVRAIVSSPPYAESLSQGNKPEGYDYTKYGGGGQLATPQRYGQSPGQLAAMPEGDVKACISSPPWERSETGGAVPRDKYPQVGGLYFGYRQEHQGCSRGQLSQESGGTFWSAARVIVSQCYQALAPGGHAVWVVKDFVRNKQRVDFTGQWRELCESCGFVTLHEHKAWLVEDRGGQYALNGDLVKKRVERKSFFRRLAEKKGSPRIDWETVLCMRKPTPEMEGI